MFKHILIPTDGSPLAVKAAAAGVKLAQLMDARVTALFAAPPPTPLVYEDFLPVGYMTPDDHAQAIAKAAERYLGVIENAAKAAGVACECVQITSDFPAQTILDTAKARKCDLIVMGSHGRNGLAALLLGSQTQKVLAQAKIPVLVYR